MSRAERVHAHYNPDTDDLEPRISQEIREENHRDFLEWSRQQAQTEGAECRICHQRRRIVAKGRCSTCASYLSRYGEERPQRLHGRTRSKRRIE